MELQFEGDAPTGPSPLKRLESQEWTRAGEAVVCTGTALMRRLIQIGARIAAPATVDELLSVPVGGAVNTGVSAYIRTA